NTHFFAYVSGELKGWSSKGKGPEVANLLMPQTTRNLGSSINAPILPGFYTATYGYKTDSGELLQRTSPVLYLPPWFLLTTLGVVWLGVILTRRTRPRRRYSAKGSGQPPYK
ncbi:MAG TPA: hypothetical protein VGP12_07155, partial [Nitrosospira sp.]|nr:hypothetical protein [Nitrosospira sp.]